jgi:ATP-dependent Lon protease
MRRVGTRNPVFMLDRSTSWGPTSAAIRRQRCSKCWTRAELVVLGPLPRGQFRPVGRHLHHDGEHADPIRPRCSIAWSARIPGYTREEKLEIAKRHLIPKQIAEHGLDGDKIRFSDQALITIIEQYTREAGVRSLGAKLRASSAASRSKWPRTSAYDPSRPRRIADILGPQKFYWRRRRA